MAFCPQLLPTSPVARNNTLTFTPKHILLDCLEMSFLPHPLLTLIHLSNLSLNVTSSRMPSLVFQGLLCALKTPLESNDDPV